MDISFKEIGGVMLSLVSISMSVPAFGFGIVAMSNAMSTSTSFYNEPLQDVNSAIQGKAFPVISVENQTIPLNATFDPKGCVAVDDLQDGNITNKVDVYGDVDASVKGVYEIRYVVRNSYGLKSDKKIRVIVD